MGTEPPALPPPSAWVQRWAHLLSARSTVLDVACGRGRHMRWLARQGHAVVGVDHDAQALHELAGVGECVLADIENGPWPLAGRQFDAVLVTNYLWRPLLPTLLASLKPGGLLICETFAQGQQDIGRPSRPEFLLQPGELLLWCQRPDWRVIGFEDGFEPSQTRPPGRFVQRIAAIHQPPTNPPTAKPRHLLQSTP